MLTPCHVEQFHPLHVIPTHPRETIPRPLLRLIFPDLAAELDAISPEDDTSSRLLSAPPVQGRSLDDNKSEAEKMREMMRRDALQDEMDEEEEEEEEDESGRLRMKSGAVAASSGGAVPVAAKAAEDGPEKEDADTAEPPEDWQSHVSGVKRVLAMDVGGRDVASPQSREAQADDMLGHLLQPAIHLSFLVSSLREDHLYCFWCAAQYPSYEEMDGPGGCPGEDEDDH
jgi:hypothetical protein